MRRPIDTEKLKKFESILNIKANDIDLLQKALTHRSFINESEIKDHNERLEFLGDAVLELIITEFLYKTFPQRAEGELTSFRAALVKTESLAQTAHDLDIGEYIYMSKGEESTGGRNRPYILANTYESILGFIYIDQGIEVAKGFVEKTLIHKLDNIVKLRLDIDNKSKLQEIAQEVLKITPSYKLIKEEGPDHEKIFTMSAEVGDIILGEGKGASKQGAAQEAAGEALKNWDENIKKILPIQ